jgi:hypothetical protein
MMPLALYYGLLPEEKIPSNAPTERLIHLGYDIGRDGTCFGPCRNRPSRGES